MASSAWPSCVLGYMYNGPIRLQTRGTYQQSSQCWTLGQQFFPPQWTGLPPAASWLRCTYPQTPCWPQGYPTSGPSGSCTNLVPFQHCLPPGGYSGQRTVITWSTVSQWSHDLPPTITWSTCNDHMIYPNIMWSTPMITWSTPTITWSTSNNHMIYLQCSLDLSQWSHDLPPMITWSIPMITWSTCNDHMIYAQWSRDLDYIVWIPDPLDQARKGLGCNLARFGMMPSVLMRKEHHFG